MANFTISQWLWPMCTRSILDVQIFNRFFSQLPEFNSHSLILRGDFNYYLEAVLDRSSPKPNTLSKSWSMAVFIPYRKRILFLVPHPPHLYSNSSLFVDNSLISNLKSCSYEGIIISDHAPLVLQLAFPNVEYTRKHWRLDPLLLWDEFSYTHLYTH